MTVTCGINNLDLDRFMVRGNMNAHLFKHELIRTYWIGLSRFQKEEWQDTNKKYCDNVSRCYSV